MSKLGKLGRWLQVFVPPVILLLIAGAGANALYITAMKLGSKIGPIIVAVSAMTIAVGLALAFSFNGWINALQFLYDEKIAGKVAHESGGND